MVTQEETTLNSTAGGLISTWNNCPISNLSSHVKAMRKQWLLPQSCQQKLSDERERSGVSKILAQHSADLIYNWVFHTFAFNSMKSTWSGVAWARHCSISARNWCWSHKAERMNQGWQLLKSWITHLPAATWSLSSVLDLFVKINTSGTLTFLTKSFSSICPRSLPAACAIRFPATRFPTITEAGPTPVSKGKIQLSGDGNSSYIPESVFRLTKTGSNGLSILLGTRNTEANKTKGLNSSGEKQPISTDTYKYKKK